MRTQQPCPSVCVGPRGMKKMIFVAVLVTKLCLTLLWPVDCRPLSSSVHGVFQAWILECIAISFFSGSLQPRDQTCVSCIGRWILYHWATREAQKRRYRNLKQKGQEPLVTEKQSLLIFTWCFWWCVFLGIFFWPLQKHNEVSKAAIIINISILQMRKFRYIDFFQAHLYMELLVGRTGMREKSWS